MRRQIMSDVPTARNLYISPRGVSAADECSFFTSLRLRNQTYKTTHARRLDDVNALVLPLLPAVTLVSIMDVAVSSGVTTLEWSDALTAAGIAHHIIAGDVALKAFLISLGSFMHVLVDATGYPLQFEFWGRAVPNPIVRRRDRVYRPAIAYVNARLARHFASLKRALEAQAAPHVVRQGRLACRELTLVSPTLAEPKHIEFVEDDIQQNRELRGRFHVVRAANILNRSYFSDEEIAGMLANLRARLRPAGLLIVCRSPNDGGNVATVFRLSETARLEIVARLGGGCDVESMALGLPRTR